ncbi:hypothetical protein BH09MYX1_BH09MYX1_05580 [soil metagenome]
MKKLALLVAVSSLALIPVFACGGGDDATKTPVDVASASATPPTASSSAAVEPTVTASATATVPPPAPAPDLVIDGIKLTGKGKDGKAIVLEVKPDGTVNKDGKMIAKFVKNGLADENGTTILSVDAAGKLNSENMKFNDKDELVSFGADGAVDGKHAIAIADDGSIGISTDGKAVKPTVKFEKLPAKSKRAATLLAVYAMVTMVGSPAAPPPAASVKPAASTKPATK